MMITPHPDPVIAKKIQELIEKSNQICDLNAYLKKKPVVQPNGKQPKTTQKPKQKLSFSELMEKAKQIKPEELGLFGNSHIFKSTPINSEPSNEMESLPSKNQKEKDIINTNLDKASSSTASHNHNKINSSIQKKPVVGTKKIPVKSQETPTDSKTTTPKIHTSSSSHAADSYKKTQGGALPIIKNSIPDTKKPSVPKLTIPSNQSSIPTNQSSSKSIPTNQSSIPTNQSSSKPVPTNQSSSKSIPNIQSSIPPIQSSSNPVPTIQSSSKSISPPPISQISTKKPPQSHPQTHHYPEVKQTNKEPYAMPTKKTPALQSTTTAPLISPPLKYETAIQTKIKSISNNLFNKRKEGYQPPQLKGVQSVEKNKIQVSKNKTLEFIKLNTKKRDMSTIEEIQFAILKKKKQKLSSESNNRNQSSSSNEYEESESNKNVSGSSHSVQKVGVVPVNTLSNLEQLLSRVSSDKTISTKKPYIPSMKASTSKNDTDGQTLTKSNRISNSNPVTSKTKKRSLQQSGDDSTTEDETQVEPNVSTIISQLFNYNKNKYNDDSMSDDDMEVGFSQIKKEEARSNRIAKREDELELKREMERELEKERKKAKRS